ncbi:isoleucyl-tRNA synthetase [Coniophora puteana RWD-64-598 SS2]|uniref:isoleucine--tRNA ligase n=1 Tax=Coniophora puteana (strain RWD-64-598) TaxID=741705 RepID=A0A5M3MF45_CONPW|nr:isoleucyl-tRNA synthetase [Coniophora puteana RWD-64-598 SS2]EIW77211.1 isoleucyl-tRNA synthetase [Coniophora puteana RWD-64-598 SS2]
MVSRVSRALRPPWPSASLLRSRFHSCASRLGGKVANEALAHDYQHTILLPKTSFPLRTSVSKEDGKLHARTTGELYRWQWKNAQGPLFVMHDGPPYANGSLHIGHALNKIIKDVINRYYVSTGHRVHYIPGWDCHGLPIENKALQELQKDLLSVPRHEIWAAAKGVAEREIERQKEEFKQFGIMADWSRESTYRTLDHEYELRQLRVFQKMVERGMIYRQNKPVYYSPSSRSALAEAELVYKDDHVSHSVYVNFTVKSQSLGGKLKELVAPGDTVRLLVWTTTPWTLTANMAIAVNAEITYSLLRKEGSSEITIVAKERVKALDKLFGSREHLADVHGTDLAGLQYQSLFEHSTDSSFGIILGDHVTPDSGTGLVHSAPAHGHEDYLAMKSKIDAYSSLVCHVDSAGTFSSEIADVVGTSLAERVVGKDILGDGSRGIVEYLRETGSLVKIERVKHRYPYDWKTDKPVIVTATSQWFADLGDIKQDALDAIEDVAFYPPNSRNRLEAFIRSRSEWCISRQRVWGIPIPALHHIPTGRVVLDGPTLSHILRVFEEKGVAHWWDGPVSDFLPPELAAQGGAGAWEKGTDTMDVWFDSGSSWTMLRALDGQADRKFLADVCLEGSDQHRGWFQSQLLTAVGAADAPKDGKNDRRPASPYGALVTHGMVLDEKGLKMSKSKGNVISPLTVIHGGKDKKKEPAYGPDVLRLWASTVEYWSDMSIGPTILDQTDKALRKIRNSARFILSNTNSTAEQAKNVQKSELGLAERYVLHMLYKLEKTALEGYSAYNFPRVTTSLINFAYSTLSSFYFDIVKDCLYINAVDSPERRAVVYALLKVLDTMTHVMAPVLPHLAEEINEHKVDGTQASVFSQKWVPMDPQWEDPRAEADMTQLFEIRSLVLGLLEKARRKGDLRNSLEAVVDIVIPEDIGGGSDLVALLKREENFLKTLFIVSDVHLMTKPSLTSTDLRWHESRDLAIEPANVQGVELIRVRPAEKGKCPRCWTYTKEEDKKLCGRCEDVVERH